MQSLRDWEMRLSSILDSMHFEASFVDKEKKRIHYLVYGYLPRYPAYQKYQLQRQGYEASEKFYTCLPQLILEEEELMELDLDFQ